MEPLFRPAVPTDTNAAVPLMYSSGPTAFDFVFGTRERTALQFLNYVFTDGAGEFGCRNHTAVVLDGKVVGIGAAYTGASSLAFTLTAARQILSFYGLAGISVIQRGLQTEGVIQNPTRTTLYIGHLGIAPDFQSHGLGAKLVEYFIAQGRAKGCTVAALDVAFTNPRAQALYERLGFVVTAERPANLRNEFGWVDNVRRMEIKL